MVAFRHKGLLPFSAQLMPNRHLSQKPRHTRLSGPCIAKNHDFQRFQRWRFGISYPPLCGAPYAKLPPFPKALPHKAFQAMHPAKPRFSAVPKVAVSHRGLPRIGGSTGGEVPTIESGNGVDP
jgi:hypothetical protein